jgi:hypothetical protein
VGERAGADAAIFSSFFGSARFSLSFFGPALSAKNFAPLADTFLFAYLTPLIRPLPPFIRDLLCLHDSLVAPFPARA